MPKNTGSQIAVAADCCDAVLTQWPPKPSGTPVSHKVHRYGAILFCGDISDSDQLFFNSLEKIYESLTGTVGIWDSHIQVLYSGPHVSTNFATTAPGTSNELDNALSRADKEYDVLFLILIGHSYESANTEGISCSIECNRLTKARPAMRQTCPHSDKNRSIFPDPLPKTGLCPAVLTPAELKGKLKTLSNCRAHVVVNSCHSGIFEKVVEARTVCTFTSATSKTAVMDTCTTHPYWRDAIVWAYHVGSSWHASTIPHALKAAHAAMKKCSSSDPQFINMNCCPSA
jgi:hypothetical protein